MLLPFAAYEMVRRLEEERRDRSLRRHALRRMEEMPAEESEVIELVFASCCEEDRLGA